MIIPNIRICPSCQEPMIEKFDREVGSRLICPINHGQRMWLYRNTAGVIMTANLYWNNYHLYIYFPGNCSILYPDDNNENAIEFDRAFDFYPSPENIKNKIQTLMMFQ